MMKGKDMTRARGVKGGITSTACMPCSQTCAYTLTAVKSGDQWIVDGFRKPTLGCE